MPRHSFKWENLPTRTQVALARACALDFDDDPARALRTAFQSRPKDWFAGECWRELREAWLANDRESRTLLVHELQSRQLGEYWRRPRTPRSQLAYLATCRATKNLRALVLDRFLEIGSIPREPTEGTTSSSGSPEGRRYERYRTVVCGTGEPTSKTQPFDHQRAAWSALNRHRPLSGLLVLPTGAGKTFTTVRWLLEHVLSDPQPGHALWLAHRAELLEQAAESFVKNAGAATRESLLAIRAISGKHGAPASTLVSPADVTLCTVQSLARHPDVVSRYFTIHPDAVVVIDEAHHAAARTYRDILSKAGAASRSFELLGLTATPTRTDEREIGILSALFRQGVLYQVDQSTLIDRGILSRPIIESVPTGQEFESQLTARERQYIDRFGDLHPDTLSRIADSVSRNSLIIDRYAKHRSAYGKTMVFAASISHAFSLSEMFRDAGIRADYVASQRHDNTDESAILSSFRQGDLEVLVSVAMLTEGFDAPVTDTVFLARPTGSLILLKQMIGRGLRGPLAGGGPTVRLVSFNDHWDRFANWLDPIYLYDEPYVAIEPAGQARRLMTDGLPWSVIREFSRLSQQPNPYTDLDPAIGWYEVPLGDMSGIAARAILVWSHQLPGFEKMIRSARRGDLRIRSPHRYFDDSPDPLPSAQDLRSFARYLSKGGRPTLIRFGDFASYAPRLVAERLRNSRASKLAETAETLFEQFPSVRSEYGSLEVYLSAIHRAVDRPSLQHPPLVDHDPRIVDIRRRLPRGHHDLKDLATRSARQHRALLHEAAAIANRSLEPLPRVRWSNTKAKSTWAFHRSHTSKSGCGIVVNSILQTSAISPDTLDFLLYHELLHHALGNDEGHSDTFRKFEQQHPGYIDASADLDSLVDRYRLDTT